jgi:hypothetical protein
MKEISTIECNMISGGTTNKASVDGQIAIFGIGFGLSFCGGAIGFMSGIESGLATGLYYGTVGATFGALVVPLAAAATAVSVGLAYHALGIIDINQIISPKV